MAREKMRALAIEHLDLDMSNFRLDPADTQDESTGNMLEEQQAKLANLAQDILDHGLSPAESLMVVQDADVPGRYTVCEGNRRLTALRLMQQPRLARNTPLEAEFKRLSIEFHKQPITHVSCVIFATKDEALLWIDRKHSPLAGRGLVQWGSVATARRDEYKSGKVRPSSVILDYFREAGALSRSLEKRLLRRTTTLDRVFQMTYLRARLGVVIDRAARTIAFANGNEAEGQALLLAMLEVLATKDFPVRHLHTKEQRESFIDQFTDRAVTTDRAPPTKSESSHLFSATTSGSSGQSYLFDSQAPIGQSVLNKMDSASKQMRPTPSTLDRSTLALKGRPYDLAVRDPRLNRLYDEARQLDPDEFPNTSAILTRVFLELSSEYFLTQRKISLPVKLKRSHWGDIGLPLDLKIKTVLEQLDPTGKDHELLSARQGVSSADHGHSVINLHAYVHNRAADVEGKEVKRLWERWQPYFRRLFLALSGS